MEATAPTHAASCSPNCSPSSASYCTPRTHLSESPYKEMPMVQIHFHSQDSPRSSGSSSPSHSFSFGSSGGSSTKDSPEQMQLSSPTSPDQSAASGVLLHCSSSSSSSPLLLEDAAEGGGGCIPALRGGGGGCAAAVERSERAIEKLMDHVTRRQIQWREVEERFDGLAAAGAAGILPAVNQSDFKFCIGMEETPEFAEELLRALRWGQDGLHGNRNITKPELYEYWRRINDPRPSSMIQILLDMCRSMNGTVTEKAIKDVILLSASANQLSMSQQEAGEYARLIMEELQFSSQGYVEMPNLEALLHRDPSGRHQEQTPRTSTTPAPDSDRRRRHPRPPSALEVLARAHWRRVWAVSLWLAACAALFAWKFQQYRRRAAFEVMGYCLCAAKGAAETLKLNMALVLLPVCRNTVTWLRRHRWLSYAVPFNDNVNFHKLIAGGIVVGVILHGGTHLACDFPRIAGADRAVFRQTIAADFQHRQPSYAEILVTTEGATGIAMVLLMGAAFGLATRAPRRDPGSLPGPLRRLAGFNTFWYSHHLFVVVYVLLVVHSMFLFLTKDVSEKTTWIYIAIPVMLYTGERAVRAFRAETYDVKIMKAATYPGKVLSLKLQKPAGFKYQSGMYIYMQCPKISKFEWHPFSLTSAPVEDHLSVHIRTLGDWSYEIYSLFQEALVSGGAFPKVCIDGPYGAASQDHAKYDVVVLVGLGIGATPFISVLKDIVHRRPHQQLADDGGESGGGGVPGKAYFYWVTREQGSFDWFRDVMKEISSADQKQVRDVIEESERIYMQVVIEMHNYLTSVYKEGDARSTLISAIQALYYAERGVDVISRTPVSDPVVVFFMMVGLGNMRVQAEVCAELLT
ncbi:hypothetical protein Taro_049742 [Colocasia esculenta]|uniref:FAD-binding FR-type domain-containing protein n=1 Tax=Colocasia esculenta TaxID=4460 RepID=A0A843XBV3_COLES|nr:hypothetical protein [Colocasia esculenta]